MVSTYPQTARQQAAPTAHITTPTTSGQRNGQLTQTEKPKKKKKKRHKTDKERRLKRAAKRVIVARRFEKDQNGALGTLLEN